MSDTSAQTAWEAWRAQVGANPEWFPTHQESFHAGYVQALLDAADDCEVAANPFKWDTADWLRARARAADAGGSDE